MLVSLIGNMGVGKSRFASWFKYRHPNWAYKSIDDFRRTAVLTYNKKGSRSPLQIERYAWKLAKQWNISNLAGDRIFEHTGTVWRVSEVYNSCTDKKIYVIKLLGNLHYCEKNVKTRKKEKLPYPYNLPDSYSLAVTNNMLGNIHANLVAKLDKGREEEVFELIEWYIVKAKEILNVKEVCNINTI